MSATSDDVARWSSALRRHAALRWLGVAFFGVALGVLGWNVTLLVGASLPFKQVLVSVFALGLSLGTFGANDDSAIVAMDRLDRLGALPAAFAPELAHERTARPRRLDTAHFSPKAALILPLVVVSLLGFLTYRASTWLPPLADHAEALP